MKTNYCKYCTNWASFIRLTILAAKMNQTEFAKAIGVTQSAVNMWVSGKIVPNRKNRAKIVAYATKLM